MIEMIMQIELISFDMSEQVRWIKMRTTTKLYCKHNDKLVCPHVHVKNEKNN